MESQWFERWFGDDYKALYPHRDEAQAAGQVQALIEACSALPSWRILDVGCGTGRHVGAFRKRGFEKTFGVDLSRILLNDARTAAFPVARADMRRLPFADGTFDLVASFFTSFGYFATRHEDLSVLRGFCHAVKPGGRIFLDLLNSAPVAHNLASQDTRQIAGRTVNTERFLEGDQVVKRIHIRNVDGGEQTHEERVRLFSLADLKPDFEDMGLSLLRILGDEKGAEFSPDTSPRMGLLLRRA